MTTYNLTQRKESGDDFDHQTVLEGVNIARLKSEVNNIPKNLHYQYYVSEWEDDEFIENINLDEWGK